MESQGSFFFDKFKIRKHVFFRWCVVYINRNVKIGNKGCSYSDNLHAM
jgi:hypothetical protein